MQQKQRFHIDGMTCQACASRIEKVLLKKPFVEHAGVNFANEEAHITFDDSQADAQHIISIIQKAGFDARPAEEVSTTDLIAHTRPSKQLILLLLINIPFWIGMIGMLIGQHNWMLPPHWQFLLASIVQFYLAIPFYKGAYTSIKGGLANMDVLVSLGTLSIYAYSTYALFAHSSHHVYFEAAVMVIGFVSLGKFLEERVKKQSLNSLGLLLSLTPKNVSVFRDNTWQTQSLDNIIIDDTLRAHHGDRIAADGIVLSGEGWTNESHLTGESDILHKTIGSKVLAGSVLTGGSLTYQAKSLGKHTLLGDMMEALSEAQGSKAPIARIADKTAAIFVPTVVIIALLTFFITWLLTDNATQGLMHSVAVLVIACPCALGLATPAAIMAGMGLATRHGIWFKDAAALETASHTDTVVIDKTGTLTEGTPTISAIWLAHPDRFGRNTLLSLAASAEMHTNHPLATAIVAAAQQEGINIETATHIHTETGEGVCATIAQGEIKVGKPQFCGITLPTLIDPIWQIASIVAVSLNGEAIGAFALADTLKADSKTAIGRLKQLGINVYIMSGDRQSVVDYIANQLGITQAYGDLSPREKAEKIRMLQAEHHHVAMVGDGINDAPALAAADTSFAMKSGTEIAQHSANATLMKHSVDQVADALTIARATLKNIKQNLFFAFFYNILGIPLAALGLLNPIIAGAAMALSSISVLSNAMRLKRLKVK